MAGPVAAGDLRIGGTGAVTDVLRALAPDFTAQTGIALVVIPSLGSSGANNAVADGQLGLAVSGRDLRDKEKARGLQVVGVLRTPYGLVTSRPGPDGLASADIVGLYKSARPLWPDGMPMLIVLRPADDSDNEVLAALFPGMAEALAQLRKRRDLSVAATDQDNADMAERMAGSLVGATLTQIRAEKRNLRFVALDGVMPSLEAYLDGSYPHGKLLYLVASRDTQRRGQGLRRFPRRSGSPVAAARPWAGRWCPVTASRTRLRALVTWLGLSVALAFTLIVPAGYFAIAYAELNHELSFAANLKANRLARYIYANQQLWQYQTHRLSQLIEVPEADESEMRQRIFDAEGKLVFEAGAQPSRPVATARVPLVVSGMTVGSVETAASMRGLIMATALVGLLSGLLGFCGLLRPASRAAQDHRRHACRARDHAGALSPAVRRQPLFHHRRRSPDAAAARRQRDRRPAVWLVARGAAGDEQQRLLPARGPAGGHRRA